MCNRAFSHSARHKTTSQHKKDKPITGCEVVISNMIDFNICRQSQKRILELRQRATTGLSSVTSDVVECLACGDEKYQLCPPERAIHKAASSSIGITPPTKSNWLGVCPEILRVFREQKMLRLRIDNTTYRNNAQKQERNRL